MEALGLEGGDRPVIREAIQRCESFHHDLSSSIVASSSSDRTLGLSCPSSCSIVYRRQSLTETSPTSSPNRSTRMTRGLPIRDILAPCSWQPIPQNSPHPSKQLHHKLERLLGRNEERCLGEVKRSTCAAGGCSNTGKAHLIHKRCKVKNAILTTFPLVLERHRTIGRRRI